MKLRHWVEQAVAVARQIFPEGELKFLAWLFPLHNGEAFGLTGRWLLCVSGFIPTVLFATAIRMWWLKRLAHRRQKECAAADLAADTDQEPACTVSQG